ncbi:hypothetical protein WN51_14661 [Melipona quadrifasciata]|uniref:Uncharacterized protein n=1 Tax=Melipona quadrifasciata TaxID=166423 RepID=A0A0N0U538_9HYME|nr:hypothetical protein WN51_14661 [Melipona quadrifasciata]
MKEKSVPNFDSREAATSTKSTSRVLVASVVNGVTERQIGDGVFEDHETIENMNHNPRYSSQYFTDQGDMYTIWSLVMVRNQLPAQVINEGTLKSRKPDYLDKICRKSRRRISNELPTMSARFVLIEKTHGSRSAKLATSNSINAVDNEATDVYEIA